jgi:hypothetical protein
VDARGREPCRDALLGRSIGQVEDKLIKSMRRVRRVPQADNLQVNRAAGQAKDGPVQAVAVVKGFQNR